MSARLVLGFVAILYAGAATAETYLCDLEPRGRTAKQRIAETLTVELDRETQIAMVTDPIVADIQITPIRGRLARESDRVIAFVWTQPAIMMDNYKEPHPTSFRLSIQKGSGATRINGQTSMNDSYSFRGDGQCRRISG